MMNETLTDKWFEARRNSARDILREAEETERNVRATFSHNKTDPLWAEEMRSCEQKTRAAREALRQFEKEEVRP